MATGELFSSQWAEVDPGHYGDRMAAAFEELRALVRGPVRALTLSEGGAQVLAALSVPVALPARGPVHDIDIRPEEPILLVLDCSIPACTPIAHLACGRTAGTSRRTGSLT